MTIYKYPIAIGEPTVIELPTKAIVRHVGIQDDGLTKRLCLWIQLEPMAGIRRRRTFRVYGTGHKIPASSEYVGTVFDGPYVWHVFQDGE